MERQYKLHFYSELKPGSPGHCSFAAVAGRTSGASQRLFDSESLTASPVQFHVANIYGVISARLTRLLSSALTPLDSRRTMLARSAGSVDVRRVLFP